MKEAPETKNCCGKGECGCDTKCLCANKEDCSCGDECSCVAEIEEKLVRVQADYANYRRRVEEQQNLMKAQSTRAIITDILQVVDTLELAIKQVPVEEKNTLYQGVELVLSQFITVLEDHGVKTIDVKEFDPNKHEAILTEVSDSPKGTILEVLQNGYELGNKTLRTAKLKLSAGSEETQ